MDEKKDKGLQGNEKIEEAILALQQEPTEELLAHALTVVRRRMREQGQLIVAVEPPSADVQEAVTQAAGTAMRLQAVQTSDGKKWWSAFTGFEEELKGSGSVMSTFLTDMEQLFRMTLTADGIEGVILNPWNRTLMLDKRNSTANALIIAGNTFKALTVLDKGNEAYYKARYDSLCQRIEQTDSLIRQTLSVPGADRAFIIYHPALSYFARDYGLHQISIEEGGKEPSPAHLKGLMDLCKKEGVRVIFVQPEFDRRNAEIIAKQTGTRVISINPLSYDWEEEMLNVARSLRGEPGY